ncbi:MAG: DUF1858 domain-containing protein [Candidatus Aenigmatarchaeota archaeon]
MITKKMTLAEILKKYPQTIEIFIKYNLPCAGCPAAQWETLGEIAEAKGIKIDKLLKELNNSIKKKRGKKK